MARDYSIDLLRIICCFLVVGIHVTPEYNQYLLLPLSEFQKFIALLIESAVRVGLPVFFVISGMYILNSNISSLSAFYKKRISSLIIPFLIYFLAHSLITTSLGGEVINLDAFTQLIDQLKSSTGTSTHYWFVYSMLGIYFISPAFNFFIKKLNEKESVTALIIIVISNSYMLYLGGTLPGFSLPTLGVWLSYFVVGGLLTKVQTSSKKMLFALLLFSFILTAACTYLQFNIFTTSYLAPFDGGINMMLFAITMCLCFKNIRFKISVKALTVIHAIAPRTYGVYLIHIAVLITIGHCIDTGWYVGNIFTYSLLMTSIVFILSLLLSYILDKLICTPLLYFVNR